MCSSTGGWPGGETAHHSVMASATQQCYLHMPAGDVRVFEGHAFIVEAAVSLGGRELKSGINVYRFANRIPLLFEGGSDVITRTALKRINWSSYKINQASDKVKGCVVCGVVRAFITMLQPAKCVYLAASATSCCQAPISMQSLGSCFKAQRCELLIDFNGI